MLEKKHRNRVILVQRENVKTCKISESLYKIYQIIKTKWNYVKIVENIIKIV